MKGSSFPSSTPAWLQRHPLLLAEWLAAHNLLGRAKAHATLVVAAGVAILGALVVVLVTLGPRLASVFDVLLTYRVLMIVAVAAYAALAVGRQRQRAEIRYTHFWLAAAPVRQYSRSLATLVVSLLPLAAQFLAACVLLAAMGVASNVDVTKAGELILWIAIAAAIGAIVGWWSARRAGTQAMEGSRYVGRVKPGGGMAPSVAALSGWPVAQVRAWGRPENLRLLVMVGMLAVQAGSSAIQGLSVVAIWLLGGYLVGLLSAVMQTAKAASQWLRSTPIPFAQFAWAVSRKALLYQIVATTGAVVMMIVLGSPVLSALFVGALWLSVVVLSWSIALAESYRSRQPLVRLVLSYATLAIVEAREQGWSIPLAALLAAWHLRAGAKA
jgi:hypothetical protein